MSMLVAPSLRRSASTPKQSREDHLRQEYRAIRRGFSWLAAGNVVNAACSWGRLALLARLGTADMVGQLTLALAVCKPIADFADIGLSGSLDFRRPAAVSPRRLPRPAADDVRNGGARNRRRGLDRRIRRGHRAARRAGGLTGGLRVAVRYFSGRATARGTDALGGHLADRSRSRRAGAVRGHSLVNP